MPGSMDSERVQMIDVDDTVMIVVVDPDGHCKIICQVRLPDGSPDHRWVAETLRRLAVAEDMKASAYEN